MEAPGFYPVHFFERFFRPCLTGESSLMYIITVDLCNSYIILMEVMSWQNLSLVRMTAGDHVLHGRFVLLGGR